MKRLFVLLLAIVFCCTLLVGCGKKNKDDNSDNNVTDNSGTENGGTEQDNQNDKHEHSYQGTVTEPTCTEGGYTTYTCSCGDTYRGDEVNALGHNYKSVVTAPTEAANGYTTYTCSCGDSYVADYTNPLISSSGLEYELTDDGNGYIVTGIGTCTDTHLIIPAVHEGVPVVEIGETAFYGCTSFTSVTIPDSVTSIGYQAFAGCDSLTNVYITNVKVWCEINFVYSNPLEYAQNLYLNGELVTELIIPDSVTTICDVAFSGYSRLTSVTIPNSVTSIGSSAFSGCTSLTSVTIPDSVTSIGNGAFSHCSNLTHVTIPDSIERFNGAFRDCSNLVYNEYDNACYLGNDSNPYVVLVKAKNTDITSCTIHENTKFIHSLAFLDCLSLTNITVPNSVMIIGDGAFQDCSNLTSATIGNGVTLIGPYAFCYCSSLKNINIGNSVTNICEGAFRYCSSLTSVIIPDSVTNIGVGAFGYCYGLISVTVGESVTSMPGAFTGCVRVIEIINKSSLDIYANSWKYGFDGIIIDVHTGESKIVNQDGYLFYTLVGVNYLLGYNGYNTELILPNNYNGKDYEIYSYAFYDCTSLTSITIPDSVTSIGDSAFAYCSSLTSITIPDSVTWIGACAFEECSSLTSVTIPDGITNIGYSAFSGCTSLTSVTIPDSITSIASAAFWNCSSLISINFDGTIDEWHSVAKSNGWDMEVGWDFNTGDYTIYCTDGEMAKNGTVTYY